MLKHLKRLGLCLLLAMGLIGQHAHANELFQRLDITTFGPAESIPIASNLAAGQKRVVHALILTNLNETKVATVTFRKNGSQIIVIKVPANSTVQVPLPSGLPFTLGNTLTYDFFYAENLTGTLNVLLTLDYSGK
jgi:hypothetical protein